MQIKEITLGGWVLIFLSYMLICGSHPILGVIAFLAIVIYHLGVF